MSTSAKGPAFAEGYNTQTADACRSDGVAFLSWETLAGDILARFVQ
jgi:hypothetical protein